MFVGSFLLIYFLVCLFVDTLTSNDIPYR